MKTCDVCGLVDTHSKGCPNATSNDSAIAKKREELELMKLEAEIEKIKKDIDSVQDKVSQMRKELMDDSQVPQLLTILIKCSKGKAIDFQTVKQKIETNELFLVKWALI